MERTWHQPGTITGTGEAMKAVGQARLELSGVSTPDHLRPPLTTPTHTHTVGDVCGRVWDGGGLIQGGDGPFCVSGGADHFTSMCQGLPFGEAQSGVLSIPLRFAGAVLPRCSGQRRERGLGEGPRGMELGHGIGNGAPRPPRDHCDCPGGFDVRDSHADACLACAHTPCSSQPSCHQQL